MDRSNIINRMDLEAMNDNEFTSFVKSNYAAHLNNEEKYDKYIFDVDDENERFLILKVVSLDRSLEYTRKVFRNRTVITPNYNLNKDLNAVKTRFFSQAYPAINEAILEDGDIVESRNGITREFLNFKTEITEPHFRCVGGHNRNINIFFLLAEAMWIVAGKDDVSFLTIFNKNMSSFSDDGKTFHAPYGHRIRHFGKDNLDQLSDALVMLKANKEDRRVVISIWDADKDLGTVSKDIPCNDMLMFKLRSGKLFTTVQNRSNDLHWGLPTNVFQFSYIGEAMASILDVEVGSQVHNSQSLHVYTDNPIAETMYLNSKSDRPTQNLYDITRKTMRMNFRWGGRSQVTERLQMLDNFLNFAIEALTNLHTGKQEIEVDRVSEVLGRFSKFLAYSFEILAIYIQYSKDAKDDVVRAKYCELIKALRGKFDSKDTDYEILALNFFQARIKDNENLEGYHSL